MKESLLDTNVILRFLIGDVNEHKVQAEAWFQEAKQGTRRIIVSPLVVAESIFVLQSFYQHSRSTIKAHLEIFLSQRWLVVEERERLLRTLDLYADGMHVVDAFLLAGAKSGTEILTFDQKLKKREKGQ